MKGKGRGRSGREGRKTALSRIALERHFLLFFSDGVEPKMLPPGAIFELKIHQNAFVWSLQRSPRTPSCFSGAASGRRGSEGMVGRGREGRRERERGDERSPLLFYNLTTGDYPI